MRGFHALCCIALCLTATILTGCPRIKTAASKAASAPSASKSDSNDSHDQKWKAIAALLPHGLKLADRIPMTIGQNNPGSTHTVFEVLYAIGANVGADKVLRDRDGLEIVFVENVGFGPGTAIGSSSSRWPFTGGPLQPPPGPKQRAIVYKEHLAK
jgi:hypothetical protein